VKWLVLMTMEWPMDHLKVEEFGYVDPLWSPFDVELHLEFLIVRQHPLNSVGSKRKKKEVVKLL
jgi:hypothetical protein